MKFPVRILLVLLLMGCAGRESQSELLTLSHADESIVDAAGPETEHIYDLLSLLRRGEAYRLKKDYVAASHEYQRFLQLDPSHRFAPFAQYQLGLCYFKQVRATDQSAISAVQARNAFEHLLRVYPESLYVRDAASKVVVLKQWEAEHAFRIGHFYYKQKAYAAAIDRFEPLLNQSGIESVAEKALYYTAISYQKNGDSEAAEKAFQRLKTDYPHSVYLKKNKGWFRWNPLSRL